MLDMDRFRMKGKKSLVTSTSRLANSGFGHSGTPSLPSRPFPPLPSFPLPPSFPSPMGMGGAVDFKVGVQNKICERSERKIFLSPHFSKCGGTSKQISVGAY